jgi:hypothetical protein
MLDLQFFICNVPQEPKRPQPLPAELLLDRERSPPRSSDRHNTISSPDSYVLCTIMMLIYLVFSLIDGVSSNFKTEPLETVARSVLDTRKHHVFEPIDTDKMKRVYVHSRARHIPTNYWPVHLL